MAKSAVVKDREAALVVIEGFEEHAPETGTNPRVLVENVEMGRVRERSKGNERKEDS